MTNQIDEPAKALAHLMTPPEGEIQRLSNDTLQSIGVADELKRNFEPIVEKYQIHVLKEMQRQGKLTQSQQEAPKEAELIVAKRSRS